MSEPKPVRLSTLWHMPASFIAEHVSVISIDLDADAASFLAFGTVSDAEKAKMRLKDYEAATSKPVTLEEVWRKRDEDKYHPKFHAVHYSEELRRLFEKRMGRVMTRDDIEKILRAILCGEVELR